MRTLRHKNITALQEVVDDPSGNKVRPAPLLTWPAYLWRSASAHQSLGFGLLPGACLAGLAGK